MVFLTPRCALAREIVGSGFFGVERVDLLVLTMI